MFEAETFPDRQRRPLGGLPLSCATNASKYKPLTKNACHKVWKQVQDGWSEKSHFHRIRYTKSCLHLHGNQKQGKKGNRHQAWTNDLGNLIKPWNRGSETKMWGRKVERTAPKQQDLPSGKLTWQWNIPMFNRKNIFQGSMFHCYVSLMECTQPNDRTLIRSCFSKFVGFTINVLPASRAGKPPYYNERVFREAWSHILFGRIPLSFFEFFSYLCFFKSSCKLIVALSKPLLYIDSHVLRTLERLALQLYY